MATSFFRYPGGKSKLLKEIISKLSNYNVDIAQYREPFFGGGSVGLKFLLDHPNITKAWINDKDVGIACLWTTVIRYFNQLKNMVVEFQPSVVAFNEFKLELIKLDKMPERSNEIIDIGFKKLAIHQMSYSGLGTKAGGPLGGISQSSKYKIDCRWSPNNIIKKTMEINNLFSKIDIFDDCCTNLDFESIITDKSCTSLVYLDPPYFEKGNELYQCGFTNDDHVRLAKVLKNTSHKWLLSYDDCEQIRSLYDWAFIEETGNINYSITGVKEKIKIFTDETVQEVSKISSRTKRELLIYNKG